LQIVVNTRLLLSGKLDGIGWFSYQTLKRITQAQPDVHFVFLFDRPCSEEFLFADNITPVILGPQARHPFLYYAWFQFSVKQLLNRMKPDLFLSPDGFLALGAKCRQLPVIHDLNFFHHPKDVRPLTSRYYNRFFPRYAQEANRIATVSQYSKSDIARSYQIDPSRIDVVYNGINEGFRPLDAAAQGKVRARYTQGKPYFLFVGSLSPRKNLVRLVQAFDRFKAQSHSDHKLLVAGAHFWGGAELKQAVEGSAHRHDIVFTGRLAQDELEQITASAFALAYVPYFEGFGIPLVEAMQCEVPILSSNTTCMPEIAGEAALYIDPYSVEDMSQGLLKLAGDEHLRTQLVEKGKLRKQHFSWDKSANLLWQSITQAL